MTTAIRTWLWAACAGGWLCAGCGDGAAGASTDAPAPPPTDAAVDAPPGPLMVIHGEVAGSLGRTVTVNIGDRPFTATFGRLCIPVTADPMTFTETARVPLADSGCGLGGPASFAPRDYSIVAYTSDATGGVVLCSFVTLDQPVPTEVTLPPFTTCPGN